MSRAILSALLVSLAIGNGVRAGQKRDADVPALIKKLDGADLQAKFAALTALAELGPAAHEAVPALAKALQDKSEDVRLNAALALGKIGKASVPAVLKLLDSTEADTRYYAVWTLGWIGPDAKDTAPRVIRALADKDDAVRRKAAYTLGRIAPDAQTALGPLVKAFADNNADVRQAAAEAVAKFGGEAVPALVEALKDDAVSVRREAARAVGKIGSEAKDAIPGLRVLLFQKDGPLVADAADALAAIGRASVATLTEALKNDSSMVRSTAVRALGKIGADAVPVLVDALGDKQVDIRRQAAQVLVPLRVSDKMVVLALAHALKDEDQIVRQQCLRGLQMLGAAVKPAAAMLVLTLKETSDQQTRIQLLYVVGAIPDEAKLILPTAVGFVKDANPQVRQAAINVLAAQGSPAVPYLIEVLKDGDANTRMQAVFAFGRMSGPDLKEALPHLVPLLKQGNPFQRRGVVLAIGKAGEPALPHLIDCLKDGEFQVRLAAVDAVRGIGPPAKEALPILLDMPLKDANAQVRRVAVTAVVQIDSGKVPDLFAAIKKSADDNIRVGAYQALSTARAPTKVALPPFLDALQDGNARIRQIACQAVGVMGPAAKDAVPMLTKLVNDPSPLVANSARLALKQIGQ